jgi:hypothetical protein
VSELTNALKQEAQNIEEDSIHSAKSHFNASSTWSGRHYWIGIPATVLGAAGGAAAIKSCPGIAGVLALLATILTGLLTFLKPAERASTHKTAGDQYLALRNDARIFHQVELLSQLDMMANTDHLKALSQRRNELNQGSPDIPKSAFAAAKKGIDAGETQYKTEKGA